LKAPQSGMGRKTLGPDAIRDARHPATIHYYGGNSDNRADMTTAINIRLTSVHYPTPATTVVRHCNSPLSSAVLSHAGSPGLKIRWLGNGATPKITD
jgi:hypothetical protein